MAPNRTLLRDFTIWFIFIFSIAILIFSARFDFKEIIFSLTDTLLIVFVAQKVPLRGFFLIFSKRLKSFRKYEVRF